jgi:hypothetical protein
MTTRELPDEWKTALGRPVKIGSLEVTPIRVEKKVVSVMQEGRRPVPGKHESLVLHLEVRNLSDKFAFVPLDNYFDRQYTPSAAPPPFTCLEVGPEVRYFGGQAKWLKFPDRGREWLEGRVNRDLSGLAPGQSAQTFVCTDGNDDKLAERLKDYEGGLVWRVHVRCGPVPFQDKLVAATAVVGVAFSDRDYRKTD